MKVGQLIKQLEALNVDPEMPVIGYSDDEGNNTANIYSPEIKYVVAKKGSEVEENYIDVTTILTKFDMLDSLEFYGHDVSEDEDVVKRYEKEILGENEELRLICTL